MPDIQSIFDSIKKTDENGRVYWTARDLSKSLGYAEYRNFKPVAEKAMAVCRNFTSSIGLTLSCLIFL